MLPHKTNIIRILTIIIIPYNLCHKFANQLIQKLRENQQQLLELGGGHHLNRKIHMAMMKFPRSY